eukprot:6191713-Pleurochrysis_carterae.AAC.1
MPHDRGLPPLRRRWQARRAPTPRALLSARLTRASGADMITRVRPPPTSPLRLDAALGCAFTPAPDSALSADGTSSSTRPSARARSATISSRRTPARPCRVHTSLSHPSAATRLAPSPNASLSLSASSNLDLAFSSAPTPLHILAGSPRLPPLQWQYTLLSAPSQTSSALSMASLAPLSTNPPRPRNPPARTSRDSVSLVSGSPALLPASHCVRRGSSRQNDTAFSRQEDRVRTPHGPAVDAHRKLDPNRQEGEAAGAGDIRARAAATAVPGKCWGGGGLKRT